MDDLDRTKDVKTRDHVGDKVKQELTEVKMSVIHKRFDLDSVAR